MLEALLWGFHNARSGLCFPSYESIADKAGCARSTVAEAIKALEDAGLLTWVNRIVRVRESGIADGVQFLKLAALETIAPAIGVCARTLGYAPAHPGLFVWLALAMHAQKELTARRIASRFS